MAEPHLTAIYELQYDDSGEIVDQRGADFSRENYSRMKYGDRGVTRGLADQLAVRLLVDLPDLVTVARPPEFLVAYKAVPPACYYLSRYCLDRLNEMRMQNDQEPGSIIKVHKSRVLATDYAASSPTDRANELASIGFSLNGHNIDDKHIVVLDDIRITGSAEQTILNVLRPERPAVVGLGYVAIFNAEQAVNNPSVERDLNVSVIRHINDLLPTIYADNFDLNIRTLKLILSAGEADLKAFLADCPADLVDQLCKGTVNSGEDFLAKYQGSYQILAKFLKEGSW